MDDNNKKQTKEQQDFIVETPIFIEEKIGKNSDLVRKYERGKFLGKGGFAKCYEIKCVETKKVFAAKLFEKKALTNDRSRKKLINEIKLHKRLHHANIVNFEHFFEDKDNVYILLELCSNQTLNEILKRRKRLTEIEVQYYVFQIVKALKYIHSHKIIHRDLKLGNCFINAKLELKLGDFGLAAKLEYEGQKRKTVCGTPNYIAPEILEKKCGHSYEVDVWSLGVVTYTLLFGKPPFETADVKLTYKKIKMNNYSFPENVKVNVFSKKFISSLLITDPSKRLSMDSILNHDFFKIFTSLPIYLPISSLACPPSNSFVEKYICKDTQIQPSDLILSDRGTMKSINIEKFNSTIEVGSSNNIPTIGDMDINEMIKNNTNILSQLIDTSNQGGTTSHHRKSESCNNFAFKTIDQVGRNNIEIRDFDPNVNHDSKPLNEYNSQPRTDFNNPHINIINQNQSINSRNNKGENNPNSNTNNIIVKSNEDIHKLFFSSYKTDLLKINNYIDYNAKFGYVYYSSIHLGVFFNDNTNLIKNYNKNDKNYQQISYYDKEGKIKANANDIESFIRNKNNSIDLVRKFEILKHIISKYATNEKDFIKDNRGLSLFYVKRIMKTQHSIMFRLSNKIIQIFFVDKSEVIMSTECNDFIFKDKNGEEKIDTIAAVMNSNNSDMIKRIKYVKSLLIKYVKEDKTKLK
jgi:polo-like kinase 1